MGGVAGWLAGERNKGSRPYFRLQLDKIMPGSDKQIKFSH